MSRATLEINTRTVCGEANRLGGIVGMRHAGDAVRTDVAGLIGAQLLPRTPSPPLVTPLPNHGWTCR